MLIKEAYKKFRDLSNKISFILSSMTSETKVQLEKRTQKTFFRMMKDSKFLKCRLSQIKKFKI